MKKLVKIVSQDEYAAWLEQQNSYYESSIKGSSEDPLKTSDEGLSTNESDAGSEEQSAETESGEES
jgi:cytochrome c oxidase subunit 2